MALEQHSNSQHSTHWLVGAAQIGFLAIAAFFMILEHRAHFYAVFPYLLLAGCAVLLVLLWHTWKNASPEKTDAPAKPKKLPTEEGERL